MFIFPDHDSRWKIIDDLQRYRDTSLKDFFNCVN
jgi:hypothetical protein